MKVKIAGLKTKDTITQTALLDKEFVRDNSSIIIKSATRIVAEGSSFDGDEFIQPCDYPTYEGGCWIRDTYYGCLRGTVNKEDIKKTYLRYKSHIELSGLNAYQVPDVILYNGATGWVGDRPALDGNPFMVMFAVLYYRFSGDVQFIKTEMSYLNSLMLNAQTQDGLAYNSDSPNRVGFGFQDSIHMTGKLAYCSVLYYDACKRAELVCSELNITGMSFTSIANSVSSNFLNTFWNGTYLKASTGLCSGQFDIMAACYAVSCGLVTGQTATNIIDKVYSYNSELNVNGFYKYVPTEYYYSPTQVWESANQPQWIGVDIYQWGGFWTIGSPHIIDAIQKIKGKDAIKPMVDAMIAYTKSNKLFEECRNLDGTWRNALYYVQTVSAVEICLDIYLGNKWTY